MIDRASTASPSEVPSSEFHAPPLLRQIAKLARYQLREYLRSRRFLAMVGIIVFIGAIFTVVVGHYRGPLVANNVSFYGGDWGGAVGYLIVLGAVLFGGDAIAGEFQNKTGYFLMGLPVRRSTVYFGKFLAVYVAAASTLLLYLGILLANGIFYFGAGGFPWQLGVSVLLAFLYLAAVVGVTFVFSSLFKTSAYGFVLTALLLLFGFTILQDFVSALAHIEPWMIITYASGTVGSVFNPPVNWGLSGSFVLMHGEIEKTVVAKVYTVAGIAEGVLIMLGYLVVTAVGGLRLFEREEFT
ncbi:MAG: ABC transporter permease [Thermoplasmata archaeon]